LRIVGLRFIDRMDQMRAVISDVPYCLYPPSMPSFCWHQKAAANRSADASEDREGPEKNCLTLAVRNSHDARESSMP
jgi:hypothetical protein